MTRLQYANTTDANMRYLVGTQINDPFVFLEYGNKQMVFLASTDIDAYRERSTKAIEVMDVGPFQKEAAQTGEYTPAVLVELILRHFDVTGEIYVPNDFSVAIADMLRKRSYKVVPLHGFCPERTVKTSTEIGYIRDACMHTVRAYEFIESVLTEASIDGDTLVYRSGELTSEWLKRKVAEMFLEHGLESPAGMIISCGMHAAMPHHLGAGLLRPHETIVVDLFPQCTQSQYFADMTRTYVKGDVSDVIKDLYEAVAAAQRASLAVLRPGLSCKEVYEVSAGTIREHGFDVGEKGYIHSLGHGIGVDVHEAPTLSARSNATLEVGNVITIEPGLYYPEIGGVRIEDSVVITEDGYETLTPHPQNWHIP